ncbi:MAG: hypothetical protein JWR24_2942 [Actinoallomurus sp.]|nr:hypothetical protein [Actinoallomurus sp.]
MSTEQLRVGDAERDEVTSALHEHFAQGRLTRDELDERLSATLSARTVGDLRKVTRDLPAIGGVVAPLSPEAGPGHRWGRPPWEAGAVYWGRGPLASARPRAAARGWGPWSGRPFGPLLVAIFMVAAFAGGWMIFPLFACVWLGVASLGIRHARRWHGPVSSRR